MFLYPGVKSSINNVPSIQRLVLVRLLPRWKTQEAVLSLKADPVMPRRLLLFGRHFDGRGKVGVAGQINVVMFGSVFSSVFGRDCSDVESDPRADPFDK